jgi:peroxiredoxin
LVLFIYMLPNTADCIPELHNMQEDYEKPQTPEISRVAIRRSNSFAIAHQSASIMHCRRVAVIH